MSDNKPNFQDDEFDVEIFAQRLYHIFLKGIKKIVNPFRVIFSKPIVLAAFILAGIAAAFILKLTIKPVYKSSFIIRPQNKGDLYYLSLLNDVHTLIKDDDNEGLMQELRLDEKASINLCKIDVNPIRRTKYTDTIDAVEVFIYTKDISSFTIVQNSLLQYMENNSYYLKLKSVHQDGVSQMEKKLTLDMLEIDSVKKLLAHNMQPRGNGGFVYGEPIDPVKVYEEGLNLFKQQISINWQKQYNNNFELVKPCVVSNKPYIPKLTYLLIICVGISLILCLIYNYRK